MNQVVTLKEAGPLAPIPQPTSETAALLMMIERAARDPAVDIGKLQQLMAMHERVEARAAESAFNDAMAKTQSEMGRVRADASNPQTRSKYASYPALDRALRPLYSANGFGLSFNSEPIDATTIRVLCYVTCAGHTRPYQIDMPADGKGAKGGDVMTRTHATGSAVSYGMRYLLKMIFNIAVGDDDGNAASGMNPSGSTDGKVISADQLKKLQAAIAETNSSVDKFCQVFKIEALPELPASRFAGAISQLDRKKEMQNAPAQR